MVINKSESSTMSQPSHNSLLQPFDANFSSEAHKCERSAVEYSNLSSRFVFFFKERNLQWKFDELV